MPLEAFGEELYYNFFFSKIFASSGPRDDWEANRDWMEISLADQKKHPASALALRCLATSFFGRVHCHDAIEKDAMKLYGRALTSLSQNLTAPNASIDFDTLAATSVLNMHEMVVFTNKSGWIQHCNGAEQLMEILGPGAFTEDKAVFAMNRFFLIHGALTARRRTFFGAGRMVART